MLIEINCPEWEVRLCRNQHWQDTVEAPVSLHVADSILNKIEVDGVDNRVYVYVNKKSFFHSYAYVVEDDVNENDA